MEQIKKKIIIRVDGNANIGLGHIYRGIALAEMLKEDFLIEFITKPTSTIQLVEEAGFNFILLPENLSINDEPGWFAKNSSQNDIIILDGYEFREKYQKTIKDFGFKLVYIDDMAAWHMYADVVINHASGIKPEDYSSELYTKFALGTKYAILRPAFLEAAKQKRTIDKIDTAFVCFGGSDISDLTYKTTKALLEIDQIKRINIIIGAAYKHKGLFSLQKGYPVINIYKNLSEKELLNIMLKSNLAIVPASTILYEVCAVKMPVISGYSVDNQKNIYRGFEDEKVILGIGDFNKNNNVVLINKLINLLINKRKKGDTLNSQSYMFDGFICERVVKLIKNVCSN